ncbi:MAG TPA: IclR family transcriptional regulator [Advenella sp.]|nr:IclR family transcriptional regulator [Advenella sp.]
MNDLDSRHTDPQFASTLAQAIDVLASFRSGEATLGNKQLSVRTGLSPSTVARLTHTLVQLGHLRRAPQGRGYRLGPALLTLSYPLLASLQLRQIARPLMLRLAQEVNGAVSLVIRDRCNMVYVETARANETLQAHPDIGAALPMMSTAAGKAWICRASAQERTAALNRIRVEQPDHYKAHVHSLTDTFREFERHGYCSNNRQWVSHSFGFAVPFARPIDANIFVLNCGVPITDGSFSERNKEIPRQLQVLVNSVQNTLGL